MASMIQLNMDPQDFDFIEKLAINSKDCPDSLRAMLAYERARLDLKALARNLPGRPKKGKTPIPATVEGRIAAGWRWVPVWGSEGRDALLMHPDDHNGQTYMTKDEAKAKATNPFDYDLRNVKTTY